MDKRETLGNNNNFTTLLQELQTSGQKASMLVDSAGLTRIEGVITKVAPEHVELTTGESIPIHTIMAVNGLFKDDFSTC